MGTSCSCCSCSKHPPEDYGARIVCCRQALCKNCVAIRLAFHELGAGSTDQCTKCTEGQRQDRLPHISVLSPFYISTWVSWWLGRFAGLVPQPLNPPIAVEGIAIPIASMFFRYRRVSRYTPPPQFALSQPRGEGGKGYRSSSCPLEGIALYRGIAEIVVANSRHGNRPRACKHRMQLC